jgi:hypothetical protein
MRCQGGTALGPFHTTDFTRVVTGVHRMVVPTRTVGRRPEWRPAFRFEGQCSRDTTITAGEQGGTALGPFPTTVHVYVKGIHEGLLGETETR